MHICNKPCAFLSKLLENCVWNLKTSVLPKKKKKWNHMEVSFFLADERCLNKLVRLNMFYQKKKKTNEKASGDKLNVLKKG